MGKLKSISPPLNLIESSHQIEQKIIQCYRTFFFPEDPTFLESSIENQYLKRKIDKYFQWTKNGNLHAQTHFSMRNLKRMNFIANFQNRNLDYFDDFAPIMIVF